MERLVHGGGGGGGGVGMDGAGTLRSKSGVGDWMKERAGEKD